MGKGDIEILPLEKNTAEWLCFSDLSYIELDSGAHCCTDVDRVEIDSFDSGRLHRLNRLYEIFNILSDLRRSEREFSGDRMDIPLLVVLELEFSSCELFDDGKEILSYGPSFRIRHQPLRSEDLRHLSHLPHHRRSRDRNIEFYLSLRNLLKEIITAGDRCTGSKKSLLISGIIECSDPLCLSCPMRECDGAADDLV